MKSYRQWLPGSLSPEVTERELRNRRIARKAATEGIVLLENDGVLPLETGTKIAVYGGGAKYTVKGGTGSGAVNNRSNVSIEEGIRNAGFKITTDTWLEDYEQQYQKAWEAWKAQIFELAGKQGDFDALYRAHATHPLVLPKGAEITSETKTDTDIAIYVISRISGEGADRKAEKGDYYLSDEEYTTLQEITSVYEKTIVILNVGGIMDLSFLDEMEISALVLLSQAGMEGGNALADVLSGKVCPSGKLTDTWAYQYEDYPSSATFSHNNGNIIEEKYLEGIYVGYRYFDTFQVAPRYPFGYGLSYTSFAVEAEEVLVKNGVVTVRVKVENTGRTAGKEVIQIYVSCPWQERGREQKRLTAFAKTDVLAPGESGTVTLTFSLRSLESYHAGKSNYYLEEGNYYVLMGNSGTNIVPVACLTLAGSIQVEKLTPICPLLDALNELKPLKEYNLAWEKKLGDMLEGKNIPVIAIDAEAGKCREDLKPTNKHFSELDKVAEEIVGKLTVRQKATLVCGRPNDGSPEIIGSAGQRVPGAAGETTPILEDEYGIGSVVMADGPAGIRIQRCYEENPKDGSIYSLTRYESLVNRIFGTEFPHEGSIPHYQFCSAIPVGTLLAQSFDVKLLQEVGEMIGQELEEFGITLWLAPGMNIHRNPLCGRNFEYYSEDPLVSGLMAAALTKGVQSVPGVGTTIKHLTCNNQEENRRGVSSIVSERALREIYLKGFEIAVKESRPMAIMTSYNKVNGVHTANSYDLCTTVVRKEWGFQGIIMTDWTTTNMDGGSSAAKCIAAGNDLVMPGLMSDIQEIVDAVSGEKDLSIEEKYLDECARRMIRMIFVSDKR